MLFINKMSSKPIYEQIVDSVERNILLGVYPPGCALPSVRELSMKLGINPNTIQKSYGELTRRGVILTSPGSGCYVSENALDILKIQAQAKLQTIRQLAIELQLAGVPKGDVLATIAEVYAHPKSPPSHSETTSEGGVDT